MGGVFSGRGRAPGFGHGMDYPANGRASETTVQYNTRAADESGSASGNGTTEGRGGRLGRGWGNGRTVGVFPFGWWKDPYL